MTEPKTIKTRCGKLSLLWFWSGVYWYVTATNKRNAEKGRPANWATGCGETRDDAYRDFSEIEADD